MIARMSYQTHGRATFQVGNQTLSGDGQARYNIAPGQPHPVIWCQQGNPFMEDMTWGHIVAGTKQDYQDTAVAREHMAVGDLPVGIAAHRRCIIPADGVYVRERLPKGVRRWYFSLGESGQTGLLGIWNHIPNQGDKANHGYFSVLHHKFRRLVGGVCEHFPIVVKTEDWPTWLDENATHPTLIAFMNAFAKNHYSAYEVGPRMEGSANDGPFCNKPIVRREYMFDAPVKKTNAPKPMHINLYSGSTGVARPAWVQVARRAAKTSKPLEGGRADGNSSR